MIYYHLRNSAKEWSGLILGEQLSLLTVTVPKSFGTRFVAHTQNALNALFINWVPLILYFSNAREIDNNEAATGYLSNFLLNFKFYYECAQYSDILNWLSLTSLAIQSEKDLKSIVDAYRKIKNLQSRLVSMVNRAGPFERSALDKFKNGENDLMNDAVPNIRRITRNNDIGNPDTSCTIPLTCRKTEAGKRSLFQGLLVDVLITILEITSTLFLIGLSRLALQDLCESE